MSDRDDAGEGLEVQRIHLGRGQGDMRGDVFLGGRLEVGSAHGVRGVEKVLLEALDLKLAGRVLVVGTREALAALAIARLFPQAEVHGFLLDAHDYHLAWGTLRRNPAANLHLHVQPDLPAEPEFDWAVLGFSHRGESMLTGEILRQAWGCLKERGLLLAATDGSRDRWLHGRILEIFGSATIHRNDGAGASYVARKSARHRSRPRDFGRRFPAMVFGKEVQVETRPGVFSHGELDEGTLALSEVATIESGARVLDLGCGSGILGIGAALAIGAGTALLVDSGTRATQAAYRNAVRNEVADRVLVLLAHDLSAVRPGSVDVALANPPYYGDFAILERFARGAFDVLAPGGRLFLVTKSADRAVEIVRQIFGSCQVTPRRGYSILSALRPGGEGADSAGETETGADET